MAGNVELRFILRPRGGAFGLLASQLGSLGQLPPHQPAEVADTKPAVASDARSEPSRLWRDRLPLP